MFKYFLHIDSLMEKPCVGYHAGSTCKATSLRAMASVLAVVTCFPYYACLLRSGDGNEAIGALIQNYIREIEELR